MRISHIRLRNFRAHDDSRVEWDAGVNLLVGPNGAGKTNVLEAIHVLCLSRSFLASSDRYVLQKGADHYEVEGTFIPDAADAAAAAAAGGNGEEGRAGANGAAGTAGGLANGRASAAGRSTRPIRVRVAYANGQGKKVFVNGAPLERVSDLVGRVPVVVFSPDDHRITSEGPDERRRMLDTIMCQWSPVYMDALIQYRRVLKQRNELLQSARRRNRAPDPTLLESWTEEFIRHAAVIIGARLRFVDQFTGYLQSAYERVSEVTERPTMRYEPIDGLAAASASAVDGADTADAESSADPDADAVPTTDPDPDADPAEAAARNSGHIAGRLREELERTRRTESDRGATQVGPHRDEILMKLGKLPVRRYASQGQHRTFGMALKLAQYDFLTDRTGEHPILLLDDVFDNLDPDRITGFLGVLASDVTGQSITTAARREIVLPYFDAVPGSGSCRVIEIINGEMAGEEAYGRDRESAVDVPTP